MIKRKPRAARIVCTEKSEFAVMNKKNFKEVLLKVEERRRNNMIDFLQSIPLFSDWSRNLLNKMIYSIDKKKVIMGQTILAEGGKINSIFIISQGEFEVSEKIKYSEQEKYKKMSEIKLPG